MFPQLPSGNNPSVGAAAGEASNAASLANAFTAAVNQQAARTQQQLNTQAAQDHQDQQDYFKAIQDGWVPAQAETTMPGGMIDRTQPAQPNMDPRRMATIGKKQMYKPTDQETGKAFVPAGQLAEALKTGGWDGKTPITPEQSHGIMQALNEAQPKDEPYEYDASGKYIDAKSGNPVPGFIGKKTKKFYPIDMSGGTQTSGTPGAAPGGAFDTSDSANSDDQGQPGQQSTSRQPGVAAPDGGAGGVTFSPPDKPGKSLHFETHTNDKGDVTTYGYDSENGDLKTTHVGKGVGPQRRDPTDPNAPKPMTPANARVIVQNKAKALSDAQKAYTKESSEAITDEDHKAANDNLRNAQQQAQLNYESELSAATGKEIPHNNWADAGASTPVRPKAATAPAKAAQPVAAPAAPAKAAGAPVPAKAAAPQVVEGTIVVNKKTKARQQWKGGKWNKLPALP